MNTFKVLEMIIFMRKAISMLFKLDLKLELKMI